MSKEHASSNYDFKFGDELNKKIASNFKTLEILIDSTITEIMQALDVARPRAKKIQIYANELLGDIKKKGDAAVHTKIDRPLKTSTHKKPEPEEEEEKDTESGEEDKYVVVEKEVDKFNKIRKRVLLTPGVCPKCGLDIIELNQLIPYSELNPSDQLKVRKAIEQHISEDHIITEEKVITKSQMDSSSWLHPTV